MSDSAHSVPRYAVPLAGGGEALPEASPTANDSIDVSIFDLYFKNAPNCLAVLVAYNFPLEIARAYHSEGNRFNCRARLLSMRMSP
jgi:hypothetical protein